MTVRKDGYTESDAPLELDATLRRHVATLLAGIDEEQRDVSAEVPLKRYDRKPIESLPFPAYAVLHPSMKTGAVRSEAKELFGERCWDVFPCYPSEVPDLVEPSWTKMQMRSLNRTDLTRDPMPAYRWARYSPSTPARSKKRQLRPGKASGNNNYFPIQSLVEECWEVQNWKGEQLRFADGGVTLSDGSTYPLAGMEEAEEITNKFVKTATFVEPTGRLDPIDIEGYTQLEAMGLDRQKGKDTEYFVIVEKALMNEVGKLELDVVDGSMSICFEALDERMTDDVITRVVNFYVLLRLLANFYKGKAATVRVFDASDNLISEYPYPWDDKPSPWPR